MGLVSTEEPWDRRRRLPASDAVRMHLGGATGCRDHKGSESASIQHTGGGCPGAAPNFTDMNEESRHVLERSLWTLPYRRTFTTLDRALAVFDLTEVDGRGT